MHLAALGDRRCVRGGHFERRGMQGELGGSSERNSPVQSAKGESGWPQLVEKQETYSPRTVAVTTQDLIITKLVSEGHVILLTTNAD